MQKQHFIIFKKTYLLFILLYIFAFSMLLCSVKQFTMTLGTTAAVKNTDNTVKKNNAITLAEKSTAKTADIRTDSTSKQNLQKNIAKNIIRLHVIANSDTNADQTLKLAVRDEIITSLQNALQNSNSCAQAETIILSHTTEIENAAYRVLSRYHSNYTVKVSLCDRYFPVKQYGDLTFPAGEYQALCVEIGKAEGRNWWCVLFPSLCFVDETTATVPDASKEKLKNSLSEEEYNSLLENAECGETQPEITEYSEIEQENTQPPEIRFGLFDWFQKHFKN